MNRPALFAIALALVPMSGCATLPAGPVAATPEPVRARNVILFVGDGMGVSTVTAARIYDGQKRGETGEENLLSFERFPHTAMVKTYNTDAQVPDSAGTATAMNAGVKTRIGYIGVGEAAERGSCASSKAHHLPLVAQAAKRAGLQVGIVTNTRITHATPAAVFAHSINRNWESDKDIPADQRPAGCADIASQLTAFPFDLALGGGRTKFFGTAGGGDRLVGTADLPREWADRTGGSYVESRAALATAPRGRPVLGLFASGHLTYMADRKPDSIEPTLTELTREALARLQADGRGYYLMVEGGRIDHAHHDGRAGYALEETVEFARAVQHAVDTTDPRETLILVTADHSHVFTIAGYPRRGNPILGLVTGGGEDAGAADQPALAADGKPYTTLGYANGPGAVRGERGMPDVTLSARQQALVPLPAETHGGEDVSLYASGPGANIVRGVIEQDRIGAIIASALGLGLSR